MDIKRAKYFSIAVEDKPGELARFARKMKTANINLSGVWGFGVGQGKAQIFAVPQDEEKFKQAAKAAGLSVKEGICFRLEGQDKVGALLDTLERVASEGVNLHALDALALEGRFAAYIWAQEKDVEKLGKVLKS
jgi:prephenate dehydratase